VNEPAVLASEHLMRLAAEFDEPQTIENGPNGTRRIGSRHARMASFSSISV
jgi:hypothetical protein